MASKAGSPNQTAQPFELKFHHGALSVPDLEASIAWWRDVLGFEVERNVTIDAIPAKMAMVRRGDLRVELFELPQAAPLPDGRRHPDTDVLTHGTKHVAFAVKDVRAVAEELKSRGVDIVMIADLPFTTVAFIRDNAGNLLELYQQPDMWS